MASEYGDFSGGLPRAAAVGTATLTSILALAIFADDYPIEVAILTVTKGGLSAWEDAGGAHVGVLLKRLAYCQTELPEGNMVRDI